MTFQGDGIGGYGALCHGHIRSGGGGEWDINLPQHLVTQHPTLLAGSLTPAPPGAPPLISEEICNQRSPHAAPHKH